MSIRKKLLLSNIAMIVIPVAVFILTAALLYNLVLKDKWEPQTGTGHGSSVRSYNDTNELYSGLIYMLDYNPDFLTDGAFIRHTEGRLEKLNAGMAIERNGEWIYHSPGLGPEANLRETLGSRTSGGNGAQHEKVRLNGKTYMLLEHAIRFGNGQPGTLYVLEDASKLLRLMRFFFPLVCLALLLVLGLTNGLLTYFVSRSIIKPLLILQQAAEQITHGNLDWQLQLVQKNEIGRLGNAFEEMRQRLKESLLKQLQYEESRKEMLSNISHDLKTPLTAIMNCVDGLRDGIADTPEKQLKYYTMMHKKASDMNAQIDELLLFSKLDMNRVPYSFEIVDAAAFLRGYTEELQLDPQNRDVRFIYQYPDHTALYAEADREKLGRVIANIVENSLKYMDKPNKEIRFDIKKGLSHLTVKVEDNGRGIAAEALPYIFERFYREDPSRNRDAGGNGLGLAIVKQIVEAHGGTAWAESERGKGTAVFFTLRRSERDGRGIG